MAIWFEACIYKRSHAVFIERQACYKRVNERRKLKSSERCGMNRQQLPGVARSDGITLHKALLPFFSRALQHAPRREPLTLWGQGILLLELGSSVARAAQITITFTV